VAGSILVVDDEADLLATYQRILQRLGEPVVAVATRHEALEVVRTQPLKMVIADVRLADGDGLDVVRAARTLQKPPPVIVVTGYASQTSREAAQAAGAAAYVAKPFGVSEFADLVRRHLGGAANGKGPR